MVSTHTFVHPHHVKVVIDLRYVQHWCGSPSEWWGSSASTTTLQNGFPLGRNPEVSMWPPKALPTRAAVNWQGLIHVHTHSIWRLWNILHVIDIFVGAHLNGSSASTIALQCGLPLERNKEFYTISKSLLTRAAIIWWGLIHMHIHSIWRLWNTLCVINIDVGLYLNGSTASQLLRYAIHNPFYRANIDLRWR